MKKLLFFVLTLFSIINLNGQTYNITTSNGTDTDFDYQASSNTIISTGNQVLSQIQTLPFSFSFYGQNVTEYIASDNGYITFDVAATISDENNTILPSALAPLNSIFAFWDDLNLVSGSTVADKVVNFTYGTSPNRVHVIQWFSVTPISGNGFLYAAIRIYESPCGTAFDVINHYGNASGQSATIGCQNDNGSDGSQTSSSPNEDYPTTALGTTNADDVVYSFSALNNSFDLAITNEGNLIDVMTVGNSITLNIEVHNLGLLTVNSFDLHYTINGGAIQTDNISTSLMSGNTNNFQHSIPFVPANSGQYYEIIMWADNINGNNDELTCNDTLIKNLWVNNGVAGNKKVLLEQFTTEPCQFCPDGKSEVEAIISQHPYVIAIAHRAGFSTDFLTTSFHSAYAEDLANGAPTAAIDRYDFNKDGSKVGVSRSNNGWFNSVSTTYNKLTPVNIAINNIIYDATSNTVDATIDIEFVDFAEPGNLALTLWVVEDSIEPVNQINYYSGNANHPYGSLPNPITSANANEYQHRNTTKKVETGIWGDAINITNPSPGDTYQRTFNNISLAGMDPGQIYLIASISYDNSDRTKRLVLNSTKEYVEGMIQPASILSLNNSNLLNIFPNPVKEKAYIELNTNSMHDININIYNIFGRKVKDYNHKKSTVGKEVIEIDLISLEEGTYILEINEENGNMYNTTFSIIY